MILNKVSIEIQVVSLTLRIAYLKGNSWTTYALNLGHFPTPSSFEESWEIMLERHIYSTQMIFFVLNTI